MAELNKNSPLPLWYQVKENIIDLIEQGSYSDDSSLPTEKQLCKQFEVSVITVRKAMDELTREGILVKKQGKGTFLNTKKFKRELKNFYGFSQDITNAGATPSRKIISFEIKKPPLFISRKLGIKSDEEIYEIRTLTLANEVPVIFSVFFIPESRLKSLKKEKILAKSIYNILVDDYKIKLKNETWNIAATALDEYEAKLLNAKPGIPALMHESISYDINDKIIMYAKGVLRSDICTFSISLNNNEDRKSSMLLAGNFLKTSVNEE
jgi:GntR family transcriptional regulator